MKIFGVERVFKNPNGGVTRKVEEHFVERIVTFKTKEGGIERVISIKRKDLPFEANLEQIKDYIEENYNESEIADPQYKQLLERSQATEEMLLAILQKEEAVNE